MKQNSLPDVVHESANYKPDFQIHTFNENGEKIVIPCFTRAWVDFGDRTTVIEADGRIIGLKEPK